jgi:PAS domain S-box-containing protein
MNDDKQEVSYPLFFEDGERTESSSRKPGNGLSDYVIRTNQPLFIPDRIDERMQELGIDNFTAETSSPAKCWLGVPMSIGNRVFGAVVVQSAHQEHLYTEHQRDLLLTIGQQVAIALENAHLFLEEQNRAAQLQGVSEISSVVSTILNPQKLLENFVDLTRQRFDLYHAHIFILDEDHRALTVKACGWKDESLRGTQESRTIDIGQPVSIVARAARTLQPVILNNVHEDPAWLPNPYLPDVQSEMAIPVLAQEKLIGILNIHADRLNAFDENDAAIMTTLAAQIGATIQNTRLFQESQVSEERLRTLIDNAPEAIIVIDTKTGKFVDPNENAVKLYGLSRDELIKVGPVDMSPAFQPDGRPSLDAASNEIEQALAGQTPAFEWLYQNSAGIAVPCEVRYARLPGEAGLIRATVTDITERKKAEELIRRRDEYLAASSDIGRKITSTLEPETIFSRAVNLVAERFSLYHTAIYAVEETGFNAILRDGTGTAGQELKKQKYKLPIKADTLVGKVIAAGEAVINNDIAKDELLLLTYAYASGSRDAISRPKHLLPETRAEAGIPLRVGSRVTGALDLQSELANAFLPDDIAVLQTLADQIAIAIDNARSYELSQQAVRELREFDRLKSQFLANMSHELRTPLNSIIGFSRVIIKGIDGPVTELQQQDLTAIYNSGQHLLALINDILDLAKIEAGKMELAFDEVNISDVINSVIATVTGLIKDKPVTITKNIAPDMPTVRADAIRIRQVLINLFSNAAKFTDEGTITVAASVKAGENSRPEIIVSVTDTGPGIAPEDQAKLFQAFSQVDDSPTRKTGGTGLGLSISQNLIQMHGGRIGVHSEVGKGSTFYFTLPVYRGILSSNDPQINVGGKIILSIDDDPQVISLYERYLHPQGYQVIAVTEPGRAKERAIQLKPFAITLDIMMPGIDGWQVLNELKSTPETRNIPVVICSIIEDHEKGFSLGAADYLSKPILEEDLLRALDGLNKDNLIEEILVIDDNPNDLKLIEKMLSNQGRYKPNLVEGGAKGWEAIITKMPQAVILDLFMPGMDGFTILENMRADARLRDIPVIILTAGDLTADQKDQLAEFGPRLIAKSVLTENDLLTSIDHALQRAAK